MKLKPFILFILAVASNLSGMAAEEVNMKFGKPTNEELQMTTYAPDASAPAVVLCRLTDVNYTIQTNGYLVDYHEKFRIKVLKPEGERYAKVVVPFIKLSQGNKNINRSKFSLKSNALNIGSTVGAYFEGSAGSMMEDALGNYTNEEVQDIKAVAYNLVNGKTVKTAMKKDAIIQEKIDDEHYQLTFTVPEVRQGTVIEYEYCVHSELFYLLHDWYAQWDIPVEYARLDMDIPSYLIFNVEQQGIQRLTYKCVAGTYRYKLESDAIAAPVTIPSNHYIFEGRQLKAMPKDSFVWNEHDHYAGMTAELKGFSIQGAPHQEFAQTWDNIDKMILDDDDLGKHLNDHSPLRNELEAAGLASVADERERAIKVYQLVMSQVKWNGEYALCPQKTATTLKDKTGNNADINLLLIQSLHDAGLQAAPVVLRLRKDGRLPFNFPSISKLSSYVVAIMLSNGSTVYVDASSTNGYLDVLPEPLLVERARLVLKGKKSRWVDLQKLTKSQTTTVIDAVLAADGTLTGTQTSHYKGLAAMNYRNRSGKNEFAPEATEEVPFTLHGEVSGNTISICPFNNPPLKKNPFTDTQRLMPVEFPSEQSEQVLVNITLPEGYALENIPQPTTFTTPDKGINGSFIISQSEGKAQVQYLLNVTRASHSEKNYDTLRGMFEVFANYSNQPLVFSKK
jgi:hypothetical protein